MAEASGKRAEEVRKALREEVRPALWYALEEDPSLASKIITGLFEKILDVLLEGDKRLRERIEEVDNRLGKRIEELSHKIEDVSEGLGERVRELDARLDTLTSRLLGLTENVGVLVDIVRRHEGRIGDVEGLLIEQRIRPELEALCKRFGLVLRRGFVREWGREVDWIVEGPGVVALLEITKRATMDKLAQVLSVARDYEAVFGRRPDGLFIYSRERPPDEVLEEAEGVIMISNDLAKIVGAIADLMRK